jgi:hypothetical protein
MKQSQMNGLFLLNELPISLSTYYLEQGVGVSTTTNCLIQALPEINLFKTRKFLNDKLNYAWKLGIELLSGLTNHDSIRVFPYFAGGQNSYSVVFVHDTTGQGGNPDYWHKKTLSNSLLFTSSRQSQDSLKELHNRDFHLFTHFPSKELFYFPRTFDYQQKKVIGYWGGFGSHKAYELIEDLKEYQVWTTGTYPSKNNEIRSMGKLNLMDLIRSIDNSQVCVYPSRNEGFGLPPYEAALRGVPVVVRNLPCYKDYLELSPELGVFTFENDSEFKDAVKQAISFGKKNGPLDALKIRNYDHALTIAREQISVIHRHFNIKTPFV